MLFSRSRRVLPSEGWVILICVWTQEVRGGDLDLCVDTGSEGWGILICVWTQEVRGGDGDLCGHRKMRKG